jgi:O-antigen ligase
MARNANASKGVYSHSNMIELLASTGFIGVALYYSIYSSIFLKLIKIKRRYWKSRMDENRELYITTFALLVIYFMYDFAMVTYQGKLSWIILSSIITSTSILSERPRNSYILDVNMRKMNESTSIVEALH